LINIKFKHFFYLSNLLSIVRLLLLVPILYFLSQDGSSANLIVILLVAFAILSDYLDGFFARLMNQRTDLGRILDPMADKILMVFGLIGFAIYRDFPLTLVLLLGYRDLMILIGGIILTKRSGELTESNIWGKGNTLTISIAGLCFLIAPDWWFTYIALATSYLMILVSGFSYLSIAMKALNVKSNLKIIYTILYSIPMIVIALIFKNHLL